MIRIDAVWLASEPLDMRAGIDSALARVANVFGGAHPHTAYLFANRRANRMKVLVHDGIGFWLAAICGVLLQPLVDALRGHILSHSVLHADETPVEMLKPGNKKTHRAYLWAYAPGAFENLKAVVYDFCESRARFQQLLISTR
jgi:hypothetical protein